MITYNKAAPLFSLHIPKCGGTSFNSLLRRWFHIGFHRHYYNLKTAKDPGIASIKLKLSRALPICIHGHFDNQRNIGVFDCYPEASQFITMLRDPIEIRISMYNYMLKSFKEGDFYDNGKKVTEFTLTMEEFFLNTPFMMLNFFPWTFTEENYRSILDTNFVHIGIMENLEQSLEILAHKLNKPFKRMSHVNKAEKVLMPNQQLVDTFKTKYPLEFKIYEYAKELNK